jgi:acyl-CoA synthetase (AMP-forming)/AMP-acid ligase II
MTITYSDLIIRALTRERGRIAFVQDGIETTYAAAADLTGRIGRVLVERGVGRGTGVAVLSPPRPEAWMVMSATSLVGARVSALHPLGSLDDHLYMCDDAEIHTLVVDASAAERAVELRDRAATVKHVFSLGPSGDVEDLIALAHGADATRLQSDAVETDICWLVYTGGTTGRPKGVMDTHRVLAGMALTALAEYEFPRDVRYLAASPITHAAGMHVVPTLLRGGTVYLHAKFDPTQYLQTIESERISLCFGVPSMVYALLDHPDLDRTDVSSLETFLYAASPMAPARLAEGLERIGPVFTQYYAQSECPAATVLTQRDHDPSIPGRLSSCGKPVATIRLALLGEDDRPVEPGGTGEICLQGPCMMDGYWNQPELTAETIRDGWLHTGDMASRDDDGFLTIVDRKKDMIVTGGFNVFPREIEDVLTTHRGVAAAAVIGVPDDKWGEAVTALVVARPGEDVDPAELIALVREKKGPIAAPKVLEFIDAIPLTPVGKADKRALRARYWGDEQRSVH